MRISWLSSARAPARSALLLQIGNEVGALLGVGHAGIGHGRAGYRFRRIGEEAIERLRVPDQLRALHRIRIFVARRASRMPVDEAAMLRPGAVVFQRMAAKAAG